MSCRIWGGPAWVFLHSVVHSYPVTIGRGEEDQARKRSVRDFINLLPSVLPCVHCRRSIKMFMSPSGMPLTNEILSGRRKLHKWLYKLHNVVNDKLNVCENSRPTFAQVYTRYEGYAAKCTGNGKGCHDPLKRSQRKKKCVMNFVDISSGRSPARKPPARKPRGRSRSR